MKSLPLYNSVCTNFQRRFSKLSKLRLYGNACGVVCVSYWFLDKETTLTKRVLSLKARVLSLKERLVILKERSLSLKKRVVILKERVVILKKRSLSLKERIVILKICDFEKPVPFYT